MRSNMRNSHPVWTHSKEEGNKWYSSLFKWLYRKLLGYWKWQVSVFVQSSAPPISRPHPRERWLHKDRCCPLSHTALTFDVELPETEIPQRSFTSNFLHSHSQSWPAGVCCVGFITHLLPWAMKFSTTPRMRVPAVIFLWKVTKTIHTGWWDLMTAVAP